MPEFNVTEVTENPYLYVERSCSMNPADISRNMGSAFRQVWSFMEANAIGPAGPALSVYYDYAPDTISFRAGFVVNRDDLAKAREEVKADVTPAGRVMHFVHKGPYSTLRNDYELMMQHLKEQGLRVTAPTWELYVNDPNVVPEEELLTEAYVSVA